MGLGADGLNEYKAQFEKEAHNLKSKGDDRGWLAIAVDNILLHVTTEAQLMQNQATRIGEAD